MKEADPVWTPYRVTGNLRPQCGRVAGGKIRAFSGGVTPYSALTENLTPRLTHSQWEIALFCVGRLA